MLFSQSIPDMVLENSAASKFVSVLDSLQEHKQGIITDAVRSLNPILSTNEKWLRKYLTDYGFGEIPKGFPIRVLQQMLLNADTIMRLRGSQLGVEFFLSVCSLGVSKVNAEGIYADVDTIYLDSENYGYVTGNNTDSFLYLTSSNERASSDVTIELSSKYFNGSYPMEKEAIFSYLNRVLPYYMGFSVDLSINWTLKTRSRFYYHGLLNPQYVNDAEVSSDFDQFVPITGGMWGGLAGKDAPVISRPIGGGAILL